MSSPKVNRKQQLVSAALERRKQRRRLEKRSSEGPSIDSDRAPAITNELLDELSLRDNISRMINLLPGSKKKRPPPQTSNTDTGRKYQRFPFHSPLNRCPWFTERSDSLSDELRKFHAYVNLDATEVSAREQLVCDVQEAILAKWPNAVINLFGSFAAGLSTFLSDIDISILGMGIEDPNDTPILPIVPKYPITDTSIKSTSEIDISIVTVKSESNSSKRRSSEGDKKRKRESVTSTAPSAQGNEVETIVISDSEEDENAEVLVSWKIDTRGTAVVDLTGDQTMDCISSSSEDGDGDGSLVCIDDALSQCSALVYEEGSDSVDGGASDRSIGSVDCDLDVDLSFNTSLTYTSGTLGITDAKSTNTSSSRQFEPSKREALENQKRQVALLKALFSHVKVLDWVSDGECRSKAKVPIIYITHRSGIGCDVSMGVTAGDTSALVKTLKDIDSESFIVLAAFLKVFLSLLSLDKPYTGGIGSYKLYVMIGFILDMRKTQNPREHDHGLLLLRFLRYFGAIGNLNKDISLEVFGAKATFDKTSLVSVCQQAFSSAYSVLMEEVMSNCNDHSLLGRILDTVSLCKLRGMSSRKCALCPRTALADRRHVARNILSEMQKSVQSLRSVTLEDVRRVNPCLGVRLESFLRPPTLVVGKSAGLQTAQTLDKGPSKKRRDAGQFPPQNYYLNSAKRRKTY